MGILLFRFFNLILRDLMADIWPIIKKWDSTNQHQHVHANDINFFWTFINYLIESKVGAFVF